LVLISGVWPPAVTSSSLSPSRRLGKHYTHPTAKATQPKPRETCTETLGLPRFLGPPRRSTETTRIRISFMDRVTVRHVALGRRPPAHAPGVLPRLNRASDCQPAASRHPPLWTTASANTTSTNHIPTNARNLAMVKFLTEAPRAALPGLPRHRQPKDLPRAGQRDGRDEGSPGWGSWPGPAHQLAPRPVLGTVAGCWHRGRLLARWPARPPGGGFWTAQVFKQLGPRCMRRGPGAGVEGGVLNAGEPRPCGWGSRPFFL
jgi:hypothetical protein